MTQPTTVFFGPDNSDPNEPLPKIFLRTLLYSSARRGNIIESMFLRVRRGEAVQVFNIWVYGDKELARGSGIYVGPEGVAYNHHFLLPADAQDYRFNPGQYTVEVFASLVGNRMPTLLWRLQISLSPEQAKAINDANTGVYFDWGPESRTYHPHLRPGPKRPDIIPELFVRHITSASTSEESKE